MLKQTTTHKTVALGSRGLRLTLCSGMVLFALAATPFANATAIVDNFMQLQSLTITPASGSLVYSPVAVVHTGAETLDQHVTCDQSGVFASCSSAETWSSAIAWSDSSSQTSYASTQFDATGYGQGDASANSYLEATNFMVTGTQGLVSVDLSAAVPYQQLLRTDMFGVEAFSFVWFEVSLTGPHGEQYVPLYYFQSYSIGPNSEIEVSGTASLDGSVTLMAGTTYTLGVTTSAEAQGYSTPEPATLSLLLAGACSMGLRWSRSNR